MRERQVQMARERQQKSMEREAVVLQHLEKETQQKERVNKVVVHRQDRKIRSEVEEAREKALQFEQTALREKLKDEVLYKKDMYLHGQQQHASTLKVLHETNPYATQITHIIHTDALAHSRKV
ncbi:hypothetical protein EON63_25335 [archaeon]|nr:MAG: hypothetical protein EON63_25335 [archaeon]